MRPKPSPLTDRGGRRFRRRRVPRREGFGLLEVMVSLSVLTIALLAFSQAILMSLTAGQV